MDKYQETFKTWNKIAQLYQDKFMELDIYNDAYNLFLKTLNKQQAYILDIACGPGNIIKYLSTHRPHWQFKGVDVAESMITLAKKNNPSATFDVLDCREIHQLQDRFDAIVCGFGLPYLSPSDCISFFKKCNHLLVSSGLLYLSFVEGKADESGFICGSTGDRTYFYYHNLEFIQKLLFEESSFKLIKLLHQKYTNSAKQEETHTILLVQKINDQ